MHNILCALICLGLCLTGPPLSQSESQFCTPVSDMADPGASTSSDAGAIVGAVVGTAVCASIAAIVVYRKSKSTKTGSETGYIEMQGV